MLEIGPGWGAFAGHALQAGVRFTGITNSEVSQSYLKGKLANFGDRFDIVLTDFYDYEPKEQFDAIVIMGVIEHLPDYERVLKKFAAAAQAGRPRVPRRQRCARRNTSCRPSWCATSIPATIPSSCSTISSTSSPRPTSS